MLFCFLEREREIVIRRDQDPVRILRLRQFADAMPGLESPLRGIVFDFTPVRLNAPCRARERALARAAGRFSLVPI